MIILLLLPALATSPTFSMLMVRGTPHLETGAKAQTQVHRVFLPRLDAQHAHLVKPAASIGGLISDGLVHGDRIYLGIGQRLEVYERQSGGSFSRIGRSPTLGSAPYPLFVEGNRLWVHVQTPGATWRGTQFRDATIVPIDLSDPTRPRETTPRLRGERMYPLGDRRYIAEDRARIGLVSIDPLGHVVWLDEWQEPRHYIASSIRQGKGIVVSTWTTCQGRACPPHSVKLIRLTVESDRFVDIDRTDFGPAFNGGLEYSRDRLIIPLLGGRIAIVAAEDDWGLRVLNEEQPFLGWNALRAERVSDQLVALQLSRENAAAFGLIRIDASGQIEPVDFVEVDGDPILDPRLGMLSYIDPRSEQLLQLSASEPGIQPPVAGGTVPADAFSAQQVLWSEGSDVMTFGNGEFHRIDLSDALNANRKRVKARWKLETHQAWNHWTVHTPSRSLFSFDGGDERRTRIIMVELDPKLGPRRLGELHLPPEYQVSMQVVGDLLFISEKHPDYWIPAGLRIMDISDPARPRELSYLPEDALDTLVEGDRLVILREAGAPNPKTHIDVFDIQDPSDPQPLLTRFPLPEHAGRGRVLYRDSTLHAYAILERRWRSWDLSSPGQPRELPTHRSRYGRIEAFERDERTDWITVSGQSIGLLEPRGVHPLDLAATSWLVGGAQAPLMEHDGWILAAGDTAYSFVSSRPFARSLSNARMLVYPGIDRP